jgi:hypothetical protein
MSKPGLILSYAKLFLVAFFLLACGGSSRQLQSLSISPATADAQNFPNGQVQFTAMGTFNGSSQASAISALWWTTAPWTYPPTPAIISLSGTGLAQCFPLAPAGTYTIYAVAPVDPSVTVSQMTMTTRQLVTTAQVTCP